MSGILFRSSASFRLGVDLTRERRRFGDVGLEADVVLGSRQAVGISACPVYIAHPPCFDAEQVHPQQEYI